MRYLVCFLVMSFCCGCGAPVVYARPSHHRAWSGHYRIERYHRVRARHHRAWRKYWRHHRNRYHRHHRVRGHYSTVVYVQPELVAVPMSYGQDMPPQDWEESYYDGGQVGGRDEVAVPVPQAVYPPAQPSPVPGANPASAEASPSADATAEKPDAKKGKADAAFERATDALRILKRIQAKQQGQGAD